MKRIILISAMLLSIIACTKQPSVVTSNASNSIINTNSNIPSNLIGTWTYTSLYYNNVLQFPIPGQTYTVTRYIKYNSNGTYNDSVSDNSIHVSGTYSVVNNIMLPWHDTIIQLDTHNLGYKYGETVNYLTK